MPEYNPSGTKVQITDYKKKPVYPYTRESAIFDDEGNSLPDKLTFDAEPTQGSEKAVQSGGVYTALSEKADSSSLSTVARSGSYHDLKNKPVIPSRTSQLDNDSYYVVDENYVHTDNNFSFSDKDKLDSVSFGANRNVKSDWIEDDSDSDAFILNKPNLSTVAVTGDYNDLTNKPTIPAAQIQSDWTQSDNTAKDFIKNKPTIPDGVEVLELEDETTGTLTEEQIALAQSDHCIIVFEDEYYYINYSDAVHIEYILNYIDYTHDGICQKIILINSSDGSYSIEEHSLDIQSDWNESDSTSVAYIKNKPTIPTVPTNVSAFTNDAGYLTQHQSLTNYVQKSQTEGLLKNDGTVDTSTYLTQHQSLSGYAKYVLCADEAEYNAISPKQSDTLYLIAES